MDLKSDMRLIDANSIVRSDPIPIQRFITSEMVFRIEFIPSEMVSRIEDDDYVEVDISEWMDVVFEPTSE